MAGQCESARAPDLSIVVVNWNTKDLLRDCLRSLYRCPMRSLAEVIVVDNGSADGSPSMVEDTFPSVRLIRNTEYRGFAAANNQAIGLARGRYVLLLNSDTLVHNGVIDGSVTYLDDNPGVGVMGCRVLNADGTCGVTLPARSPKEFAALLAGAIRRLAEDSALLQRLSNGARLRVA